MNEQSRKEITEIVRTLSDCRTKVEVLKDTEEEKLENMPDNLKQGDKGQAMEEAIENFRNAVDDIDNAISSLENIT